MSIIYDALQKTQRSREYLKLQNGITQAAPHRRNTKWMVSAGIVLVLSAGIGALITLYWLPQRLAMKAATPVAKRNTVTSAPEPDSAHFWITNSQKTTAETPSTVAVAEADAQKIQAALTQAASQNSNSRLTLNGVMITGSDKIALINNQSFRLGDVVDGMKIVGIEFNGVKLQDGQRITELRVPV